MLPEQVHPLLDRTQRLGSFSSSRGTVEVENKQDCVRVSKIGWDKAHIFFLSSSVPELEFVVMSVEREGFGEEVDADGGLYVYN